MKVLFALFILIVSMAATNPVLAKTNTGKWIFTPVIGYFRPSLEGVFGDVFQSSFSGRSEITTAFPEDAAGDIQSYPEKTFIFENPLSRNFADAEGGLEFRRTFGKQDDFYLGISAFETTASNTILVGFPIQGEPADKIDNAKYERRGKFSYTRYFLGWRHYLYPKGTTYNFYVNMSLHEIFDIDYQENHVFDFVEGKVKGFSRNIVLKTHATGLLMIQLGIGGERQLTERFSIGFEGGFAFGIKDAVLKGTGRVQNDDFNDGDRVKEDVLRPAIVASGNGILAVGPDGVSPVEVKVRLNGWRIAAKFNVAF